MPTYLRSFCLKISWSITQMLQSFFSAMLIRLSEHLNFLEKCEVRRGDTWSLRPECRR